MVSPGTEPTFSSEVSNSPEHRSRPVRHDGDHYRRIFAGPAHSEGVPASLRLCAEGFDMAFRGAIIRGESYLLQFTDTQPRTIKSIEMAFEPTGRQVESVLIRMVQSGWKPE
jgi:hypothetical protein